MLLDEYAPLERYGHNLTWLARQGTFAPLADQEVVAHRVFQILSRKRNSVPMIIDGNEARRSAMIIEVIRQMALSDAPEAFPTKQVIALDYEALFSNPSDDELIRKRLREEIQEQRKRGQYESHEEWRDRAGKVLHEPLLEEWITQRTYLQRLRLMFIAMCHMPDSFILFVDNFHRIIGGDIDAFYLLIPALARRQIQMIGACSLEQYRQYIERDRAIQARCQEVIIRAARREYWPEAI